MKKSSKASKSPTEKEFEKIEKKLLTKLEQKAGFKVIGIYTDEESTPVPPHCFVRYGYIIEVHEE